MSYFLFIKAIREWFLIVTRAIMERNVDYFSAHLPTLLLSAVRGGFEEGIRLLHLFYGNSEDWRAAQEPLIGLEKVSFTRL